MHDLTMKIVERGADRPQGVERFYAHFKSSETKSGEILTGTYGDGDTPEDAIANYAPQISEKTLVIDAMLDSRRVIQVPRLKPTPPAS